MEGQKHVCCAAPVPVVERLDTVGSEIVLSLQSCMTTDCFCEPPMLTSTGAWFNLGELPSGEHLVRVGAIVTSVSVP